MTFKRIKINLSWTLPTSSRKKTTKSQWKVCHTGNRILRATPNCSGFLSPTSPCSGSILCKSRILKIKIPPIPRNGRIRWGRRSRKWLPAKLAGKCQTMTWCWTAKVYPKKVHKERRLKRKPWRSKLKNRTTNANRRTSQKQIIWKSMSKR